MNATEELVTEHKAIKRLLRIMEVVCQRLEAGQEVDPEHLVGIVEFIQVFADKCHHGKEEDLLFGAMEEAGVPRQGGPIGVMLAEHDMGRGYVRAILAAIPVYTAGNREVVPTIVQNARDYVALLTQHIHKEDNILYPMADRVLSPAKQVELLQEFARVEQEQIGPGRHEAFHKLLDVLEATYPG